MKDFVSKATFGFLMAQLFPGAVAILGLSFMYFQATVSEPNSVLASVKLTVSSWSNLSTISQLFLVGSCVGTGMLIHGLHWSVIGCYECKGERGSIFDSFWHKKLLAVQVLGGPAKIVGETIALFRITDIRKATVGENAVKIGKDFFPSFEFLQDFYLYSAQFFAHTAYGLLIWVSAVVWFVLENGLTHYRLWIFLITYVLCGLCFVLGRLQLRSLFSNEEDLVNRSNGAVSRA